LQRDFSATRADEKWCADFTYIRCWEGVVFFSFVIDVFSRMIVGWQFAAHMRTELVADALEMAVAVRGVDEDSVLIHHSDRGSQYTSHDFNDALDDRGILASLGSTGDAYDNALAESFVDSFKTELIADRVWRSRDQLELAIVEWVGWYDQRRLHSSLGDIPPAEFEALAANHHENAAMLRN
jgi:putative transposase